MGFFGYFRKGIDLALLKGEAADEVAADPDSFVPAMVFFVLPSLVMGLLVVVFMVLMAGAAAAGPGAMSPEAAMLMPLIKKVSYGIVIIIVLFALVGSVIGIGVLHLIAKMFGGQGRFLDYYQTMGIGSLVSWGGIIPYVGFLFSLWTIPVSVVITSRVHNLSTGKSVAVVLIPLLAVFALIIAFIVFVGMGMFMQMAGNGAFQATH